MYLCCNKKDFLWKCLKVISYKTGFSFSSCWRFLLFYSQHLNKNVSETKYTCSIGYHYQKDGSLKIDDLLKASDTEMYLDKAEYYNHKK